MVYFDGSVYGMAIPNTPRYCFSTNPPNRTGKLMILINNSRTGIAIVGVAET